MKSKIFMYLFFFMTLLSLFQYTNSKGIFKTQEKRLDKVKKANKNLEQKIKQLEAKNQALQYFSLDNNDDALDYFQESTIKDVATYVADKLIETNLSTKEHPLIPYVSMHGGSMKLNKIKVLNHKWIIADFSDGNYWGELLIKYTLQPDTSVDFTLVEHLLYAKAP